MVGLQPDIQRAIDNILSNAVKYSWTLRDGQAWVDVRVMQVGDCAHVEVENWGVPIAPDELTSGSIFEFMSRGKHSSDRARTGTGIGLWDTRSVARRHGGDVDIRTRPARAVGDGPPHIITATLILPTDGRIDDQRVMHT